MAETNAERDPVARYLSDIRDIPRLSREEETRVLRAVREGDAGALQTLVKAHLGFVVSVAGEYRSSGLPFEDLVNEGNLGLIRATERFDLTKGTKFITYAVWWIRKTILQAITEKSRIVRLPDAHLTRIRRIRAAEAALRGTLRREPSKDEVSSHLATTVRALDATLQLALVQAEPHRPKDEDSEPPIFERLRDHGASAEQEMIRRETRREAVRLFGQLEPRERRVLSMRLGLSGEPPQTLAETGAQLGLSRERIRQIENIAKRRLRRKIATKDRPSGSRRSRACS